MGSPLFLCAHFFGGAAGAAAVIARSDPWIVASFFTVSASVGCSSIDASSAERVAVAAALMAAVRLGLM